MDATTAFDDAETFFEHLLPHKRWWAPDPRAWLFRGQAAEWPLVPSAFRPTARLALTVGGETGPRATHAAQVRAEWSLLRKFRQLADAQGLAVPNEGPELEALTSRTEASPWIEACERGEEVWPPRALRPLAALAQHYGVPTRLVDWSRRPLVATYFAAAPAAAAARGLGRAVGPEERLVVYALRRRGEGWRLEEAAQGLMVVAAPRAQNPNLHLQSGVFTLRAARPGRPDAPVDTAPLDALLAEVRHEGEPVLRRFTLPVRAAPRLLEILASHFVHGGVIHAGFRGVAEALREYPTREGGGE